MHHLDHCLLLHLTRMKAICNPEMCAKQPVTTCDSLGVLQHWTHQDFSLSRLSHPLQAVNNYDKEVFNGDPGYVVSVDAAARRVRVQFTSSGESPAAACFEQHFSDIAKCPA